MDSYGFIDSIQAEKTNAIARYRRFNNISKNFRAIEVFVAVVLISWSSTHLPTVFKVSGEYLYACSSYVLNQYVVFIVGNVIVVVCYVLSGHTDLGTESEAQAIPENSRSNRSTNNSKASETDSNIDRAPPPVKLLPEEAHDEVVRHENAIKQAVKQIERFHRTQSAKLSREISTKPSRELRRSVTERPRSVAAAAAGEGDSKTSEIEKVETLSNEEFRRTVEAFISKQQSFLKQQTV